MKRILPSPLFPANHVLATESNPLDYLEDLQLNEGCRGICAEPNCVALMLFFKGSGFDYGVWCKKTLQNLLY